MPDYTDKLDEWSKAPSTVDEDGVIWPTLVAIAAARELLEGWEMVPDGDGGIVFSKRLPNHRQYDVEINASGDVEVLVFQDARLIGRHKAGESDVLNIPKNKSTH